ncbi:MAG: hypothetical protein ACPL3C_07195 [Pyrobaculum sp.]
MGRATSQKGLDLAVRALDFAPSARLPVLAIPVGDFGYEEYLRRLVRERPGRAFLSFAKIPKSLHGAQLRLMVYAYRIRPPLRARQGRSVSNYIGFGASGDVNSRGPLYAANKTYWMVKSVEHQLEQAGVKRGVVLIALDGENSLQYFKDGGVQYLTYLYGS